MTTFDSVENWHAERYFFGGEMDAISEFLA